MLEKQIYPVFSPILAMNHEGNVIPISSNELIVVDDFGGILRTSIYGSGERIYINYSELINLN